MTMTDMNIRQNNHIDVESDQEGVALSGWLRQLMEKAITLGDLEVIRRMEAFTSYKREILRCMLYSIKKDQSEVWNYFAQRSHYDDDMMAESLDCAACNDRPSMIPLIASHISNPHFFYNAMQAAIEFEHGRSIEALFPYLDDNAIANALNDASNKTWANGWNKLAALYSVRSLRMAVAEQGQGRTAKKM